MREREKKKKKSSYPVHCRNGISSRVCLAINLSLNNLTYWIQDDGVVGSTR
ncbi:hypothetical protein HYC85_023090 [Camellia sinensis]|uniref:Uncharacterized protein n=1 Tax=Camellia sinensis TaxID=4442 RepID=A0A7J7GFW4_CAMSI|nr:hypothetical protein HYC85_023090 [Camellia sinensis]